MFRRIVLMMLISSAFYSFGAERAYESTEIIAAFNHKIIEDFFSKKYGPVPTVITLNDIPAWTAHIMNEIVQADSVPPKNPTSIFTTKIRSFNREQYGRVRLAKDFGHLMLLKSRIVGDIGNPWIYYDPETNSLNISGDNKQIERLKEIDYYQELVKELQSDWHEDYFKNYYGIRWPKNENEQQDHSLFIRSNYRFLIQSKKDTYPNGKVALLASIARSFQIDLHAFDVWKKASGKLVHKEPYCFIKKSHFNQAIKILGLKLSADK